MNPTPHIIESALLLLAAFLIGCVIGYFFRWFITKDSGTAERAAEPASSAEPVTASTVGGAAMPAKVPSKSATETSPANAVTPEATAAAKPAAESKPAAMAQATAKPRSATRSKPAAKPKPAAKSQSAARPKAASKPVSGAKPAAGAKAGTTRAAAAGATKPRTKKAEPAPAKPAAELEILNAPRGGAADDLKKIKGIGPKLEVLLNENGIYHYDQIAKWSRANIASMDEKLSFRGRIDREEWVPQAKVLAKEK